METGVVTLSDGAIAPAIVLKEEGDKVMLWVFLLTGPIQYRADRGDVAGINVFVSD